MSEPVYSEGKVRLYQGDVLDRLREMPAESVHCVVSSPPYFGLRTYGTETWEGGDEGCAHSIGRLDADNKAVFAERVNRGNRDACLKCGAKRIDQQLGLEATPEEYIAKMVAVFAEVRRVLHKSGVMFVNMGDSYFGDSPARKASSEAFSKTWDPADSAGNGGLRRSAARQGSLKPKDLIGMPWRLAFALQADGWWLRSDIIWAKPNPMPESVDGSRWEQHRIRLKKKTPLITCPGCGKCDPNGGLVLRLSAGRPTKAHEFVFLMAKAQSYFYDTEAIREPLTASTVERYRHGWNGDQERGYPGGVQNHFSKYMGSDAAMSATGRNKRTVWEIATEPFPEAHFATFPTALVEPCIKAGSSEKGVCPVCLAPWIRETERALGGEARLQTGPRPAADERGVSPTSALRTNGRTTFLTNTTGWRPSCKHEAEPIAATVLDPFAGSGTTLVVARDLGRFGIGIELNPEYIEIAKRRLKYGGTAIRAGAKADQRNKQLEGRGYTPLI